jgi:hypothetical protein
MQQVQLQDMKESFLYQKMVFYLLKVRILQEKLLLPAEKLVVVLLPVEHYMLQMLIFLGKLMLKKLTQIWLLLLS